MLTCESCGATAATGRFCRRCGGPLTASGARPAHVRRSLPAWAWGVLGLALALVGGGVALWAARGGVLPGIGAGADGEDLASVLALLPGPEALPAGWTIPPGENGEPNPFVTSDPKRMFNGAWGPDAEIAANVSQAAIQGYRGGDVDTRVIVLASRQPESADALADLLAVKVSTNTLILQRGRIVVTAESSSSRRGRPFREAIRERLVAAGFVVDPRGLQARAREQERDRYRQSTQNESATIGDVRTVISGQAAYQASNAGFFEARLTCLASPTSCIPQYPPNAPTFLDPQLSSLQPKSGYARAFHPGPAAPQRPAYASDTSVLGFAYTAVPVKQGETGVRSFCGDARGAVMFCSDGRQPPVSNGSCAFQSDGCAVLQ